MVDLLKPWLWVSPQVGHRLAPLGFKVLAQFQFGACPTWKSLTWRNLNFPNPLGVAGGLDKNAFNAGDWTRLGAGFVEIGTVTPLPQGPNPGQIMDRNSQAKALWNKMGFPSHGAVAVKARLEKLNAKSRPIIFLNVGKNRETPNNQASRDYLEVMKQLESVADVFVINISSPNTQALRQLLLPENLKKFLQEICSNAKTQKPILLKMSPDMTGPELESAIEVSLQAGISGFVISNSMMNPGTLFAAHEGGGVSGLPLKEKSRNLLQVAVATLKKLNSNALLVSVGGIMDYAEIETRLKMGAHLVQAYSAVVFEGPGFFRKVGKEALKWQ